MNIVCLDGYALNPGDISWEPVEKLGNFKVYDTTSPELVLERAKDAEIVLTNKVVLDRDKISNLPNLKYIGVLATGYNVVDIEAAKDFNIVVTNIPSYSTDSVAQLVIAFILEFCHRIQVHSDEARDGKWSECKHFCYHSFPITELCDKTLGVIGFGNIGKRTAELASAFGMNVLFQNRSQKGDIELFNNKVAKQVEMDELLEKSDFISLNCPLTKETENLVDKNFISKMKKGAFIINTGRGGLINESDVAEALNSGALAGLGADVLSTEPPQMSNPLLSAKNCFITPHIAWQATEARTRLMNIEADNIEAFIAGKELNRIV